MDTCIYDVVGGHDDVAKKQKQLTEEIYSEVFSPATNINTGGGESKDKFKLLHCSAYGSGIQLKVGEANEAGDYEVASVSSTVDSRSPNLPQCRVHGSVRRQKVGGANEENEYEVMTSTSYM